MSESRLAYLLRYGRHANTGDFSTAPGSLTFLEPMGPYHLDPKPRYADREWQTGRGQPLTAVVVGKETSGIPALQLAVHSLSDDGAGDGVDSASLDMPLSDLLESHFGARHDEDGELMAAAPGTGTALVLDAAASFADHGAFLFKTVGGSLCAREAYSATGANISIDRALTTKAGVATTPDPDSVAYAMRGFLVEGANAVNRRHLWLDGQGVGFRRILKGWLGATLELQFPPGGYVAVSVDGIQCTDWEPDTPASLSYAEPDRGGLVHVLESPCWFGATQRMAYDFSLRLNLELAPRRNEGAPNGHSGFAVVDVRAEISCKLRMGGLTGELLDAAVETIRAAPQDFAAQINRTAGGSCYIRAPNMDTRAEIIEENGLYVVQINGMCKDATDVATAFGSYPLRVWFG